MSRGRVEDTPEVKAFERSASTLEAGLNPDDVTNLLFSAGIISRIDREKITSKSSRFEKVQVLISAVGTNLSTNPGNFKQFVAIVNREPSFVALVAKLNEEYEKAKAEAAQQPAIPPTQQAQSPPYGYAAHSSSAQTHQYGLPVREYQPQWGGHPGGYHGYEGLPFSSPHPPGPAYMPPQHQSLYSGPPTSLGGMGYSMSGASAQTGLPYDSAPGPPRHPVPEPSHDEMVDNTPLTIRDLIDVQEAVDDVVKWYDFGLALRLHAPVLDRIKAENPTSIHACLREVLKTWLKKSSAQQPSTWRELAKALRRKSVDSHDIADMIAKAHSTVPQPSQDRVATERHRTQSPQLDHPPSFLRLPSYGSSQSQQPPSLPQYHYIPHRQEPSAPWGHHSSYPSYPSHEEQSWSQQSRFDCQFEHQFKQLQIAVSDDDKKKMVKFIFSKHQAKVTEAVQNDLVRFAHEMESHGIINQRTARDAHGINGKGSYELAALIVNAVRTKIENYPQYFSKFVQGLESFDADLSRDLMHHYRNQLAGQN